jgi:glycosyltransferase involved in cell wall biosynthesis
VTAEAESGPGRRPGARETGRLRVAHVIDSLAGSGGAENRLVDEVVALTGRVDQVVVRLFEQDFLEARLAEAGVPVVALGFRAGRAARTWPVVARRLAGALRGWRPDVVHTSLVTGNLVGQLAAQGCPLVPWSRGLGVPVVSTFNRTGDRDQLRGLLPGQSGWKGRVMHAVHSQVARSGDVHYRAVGRSALETNCASLGLPVSRATVVPRGVDVGSVAPADRSSLGVGPSDPLFVNVARLVPEKAQHLLVEAFAAVLAELPSARLLVAGAEGPNTGAVRAAVSRLGIDSAVTLLGFRSDARSLVAAADVFAFSSLSEGSPGAVVEALRIGTPVAAFDIPPVAEITGDGEHAWLAPTGAVDGLAKAMLAAHQAPDRAERAAAAQAWASQFSLPAVADQLGDLLDGRVR